MAAADAKDEEFLKHAMLADLGRDRQEELPLSDNHRGYRYNPERGRGVNISRQLRSKLQAWGNPIQDEESRQMEGLEIEGATWRQGRRPAQQTITVARATMPKTRSSVPKGGPLRDHSVPTPKHTPRDLTVPAPNTQLRSAPAFAPGNGPHADLSFKDKLAAAARSCSFDSTEVPEEFDVFKAYWGVLMVRPKRTELLLAKWEISIHDPKTAPVYATLTLTAVEKNEHRPARVHNISHLNRPYVDEEKQVCVLATVSPVASASYYVQLSDLEHTKQFSDSLYGLQLLVHEANSRNFTPPASPDVDKPLVDIDSSEPAVMDTESLIEAVCHIDKITSDLAKINFNPKMYERLDEISHEWFKLSYPDVAPASRANLTTCIQDMLKRSIGLKQDMMICEDGPVKPTNEIPESMKAFPGPITYTKDELRAHRPNGQMPELPEWTSLTKADEQMVWKPKEGRGLAGSRWSS